MQKVALISFVMGIFFVGMFSFTYNLAVNYAYADTASLTPTRPSAGDLIEFFHNGQKVSVNWTQFSRQVTQDVNWVGLNTTTSGAINWNYIGQ